MHAVSHGSPYWVHFTEFTSQMEHLTRQLPWCKSRLRARSSYSSQEQRFAHVEDSSALPDDFQSLLVACMRACEYVDVHSRWRPFPSGARSRVISRMTYSSFGAWRCDGATNPLCVCRVADHILRFRVEARGPTKVLVVEESQRDSSDIDSEEDFKTTQVCVCTNVSQYKGCKCDRPCKGFKFGGLYGLWCVEGGQDWFDIRCYLIQQSDLSHKYVSMKLAFDCWGQLSAPMCTCCTSRF